MEIKTLPVDEIYIDSEFNCRGYIPPFDVADLVQQIRDMGLQIPISVHEGPWKGKPETAPPAPFGYRIIAGHRRFTAFKILREAHGDKYATIPCIVKSGMTEIEGRVLNLSENLDRKQLNILQESKAIEGMYHAGVPQEKVGELLHQTRSWVQTRFCLLAMPEEIQKEAAAGMITHLQIKQLYSLDTDEERFAAVRRIKEAKLKNISIGHVGKRRKKPLNTKKNRPPEECYDMIEVIGNSVGYGIQTRALAWAAGAISTAELFDDIRKACEAKGEKFYPPSEF